MIMHFNQQVRVIAFYLPQFHPIHENDEWYGKGFTEWTNVGKAKPLFRNHYQPRVPADLGYYDLRLPDIRIAQAELAKKYGIEGFCYWHYWFGNGKQLLERPFKEVLESGNPNFPFCLAWANHSWEMKTWDPNKKNKLLIEQTYPGEQDYINHFNHLLNAFKDERYIKVNGKPLFVIYDPFGFEEISKFIKIWRNLAVENGLPGMFLVAQSNISNKDKVVKLGFDSIYTITLTIDTDKSFLKRILKRIFMKIFKLPLIYNYNDAMQHYISSLVVDEVTIPSILPNWDHSPRSGRKGLVLVNSKPEYFKKYVIHVLNLIKDKPIENRLVFLRSWNEWAEGNYIEPDLKYGLKYLEALNDAIQNFIKSECGKH